MKGNVLIIGASGDIGSAIAIKLGQEGYQLLLHYNQNKEKINNIRAQLRTELILSEIQADLSDDQDIKRLITEKIGRASCREREWIPEADRGEKRDETRKE